MKNWFEEEDELELLKHLRKMDEMSSHDWMQVLTVNERFKLVKRIQAGLKRMNNSAFEEGIFSKVWKRFEKYSVERWVRFVSNLTLAINGIINIVSRVRE